MSAVDSKKKSHFIIYVAQKYLSNMIYPYYSDIKVNYLKFNNS